MSRTDAGPATVDLFAGAGGLSLGFSQAGFDVRAAYDSWQRAVDVYSLNFEHPVHRMDVARTEPVVESIAEHRPEVLIGGPPCQDFSTAGKRVESGNASLTEAFATVAVAVEPKVIVMENVPRARHSEAYGRARQTIAAGGYDILTECVLDASMCDVPQRRRRFFLVAARGRSHEGLGDWFRSQMASTPLSVEEYMGDEIDTDFYAGIRGATRGGRCTP